MNERTVFLEALDKQDPRERAAFLETACAGDDALRQRVEALLNAHSEAGDFLGKLALERVAEELLKQRPGGDTQSDPSGNREGHQLTFLEPSEKPDSLGRLGHYEIREVIGRGGMGVVLKAFDEQLHRVVAIKVMAEQLATNATARKRFTREAQAAAAVSHDHIVTIHAVDGDRPQPYLVMQYVAGMSLQQRLDRDGSLQLQEILRIGVQTASGLAAAHAQGLVHRDTKPANILLENGVERVKITDFGLARAANEANLTQSGVVAGTPQYMSPEQAEGKALDQRTDLFSLGSVLYAMCTGRAPFRGSGTVAVLKRVCEEVPTSIRLTNPDIPEWLVAIIGKLHAKDPDQRFQTAAEVAQVLGQHLAHVQHPSVVPLPATPQPSGGHARGFVPPLARRQRPVLVAAVLLCFLAGLSLTEATGVTNVRATLIRIFTPEGTLVVETDDPAVKVTVEGDGGLVITGAGLEEIRLLPGSYKVQAAKDGKPVHLDQELVTISRGDKRVVRVRLESTPSVADVPKAAGAFVLMAGQGVEIRRFDTLAEAVQGASDGDSIEIRGNGPFVSDGVASSHPLVIRAGEGYTPSITLNQAGADKNIPLLSTSASLVLEGLELRRIGGVKGEFEGRRVVLVSAWGQGTLHATNCRFVLNTLGDRQGGVLGCNFSVCSIRNCQFCSDAFTCIRWYRPSGGRGNIENCLGPVGFLMALDLPGSEVADTIARIRRNTTVGACLSLSLFQEQKPAAAPPVHLDFSENVTHCPRDLGECAILRVYQWGFEPSLSARDAEDLLGSLVGWHEQHNVHMVGTRMLHHCIPTTKAVSGKLLEASQGKDLADWNRFWKQSDTGSVEGAVRFQGGDLLQRALNAPEKLTPEDFRLRPDSAGFRAGKDGKDLGADVDLVGPGPAYERWKKTPEYQQWLKDTGQSRK